MSTLIIGKKTGTKRNPRVVLEMSEHDAQKLLIIVENDTIIGEAMEFMGLKFDPVMGVLGALRRGLMMADIRVK